MNGIRFESKWSRGLDRGTPAGVGAGRRRARRRRDVRLVEPLEERTLLSTLNISSGALTFDAGSTAASAPTISVYPSDTADVEFSDPDQDIDLGAGAIIAGWTNLTTNEVVGPADTFSSVDVTGSTTSGQDLTIDYTTGDPLPSGGLTFAPTGGATNALTLTPGTGSFSFTNSSYSPTGAGAGTITYSDSANTNLPITFSNLSPVMDTVPSPTFIFNAPAAATTVNVVDGASGTTQINDGGTGAFEEINFANKATVTVNVENAGATTTVDTTTTSAGLSQLFVDSGAGTDTINVEGTPSGVTTTTDTGSPSGSMTSVGLNGLLTSILGPVVVQSTGGSNALTVNDSAAATAQTYTLDNSVITASSLPSKITMSGTGLTTLNLDSSGGSTVNLSALAQGGVTTYNFTGGTGLGANTLNISSNQTTLDYATAGTLGFGAGQPTVNYTNFTTANVTKPATTPTGTAATTIKGTAGQALNGVVVATFTDSDLATGTTGFVASINWGDGTTTAGTITQTGSGSYEVTGSHTFAASGTYSVGVTLTDLGTSGSATVGGTTLNVTSAGPLAPITITSSADIAPVLVTNSVYDFNGVAISAVQDVQTTTDVATFRSTDTTAVPADFTATINWGDSTPTTAGTITEDASGTFHVSGTHTYTKAGSFAPTVTITDINGTTYATGAFYQTNLVSSVTGDAAVTDPNLINPWGMSSSSTSPIWISDQGSGVATVYNPNASPITPLLTVTVPPSSPTGQVFNTDPNTGDFIVPGSSPAAAAHFLFATLAGTIDAWASGASAVIAVPAVTGATFTGLTQASVTSGGTTSYYLYAADFNGATGANGIDVFNAAFTSVTGTGNTFDPATAFLDPNAIAGYDPYNIALLNGNLYVAYAKPSGIVTTGGGYIDEFSTSGAFISRVYTDTTGTNLAGPWGMAIAPSGFGSFGGDLLVGNFGNATSTSPNGTIVAINLTNGTLAGTLDTASGTPIADAGLWGLLFGNGGSGGSTGTLYVSAGINGQTGGLLAAITPATSAAATVAAAPLVATGATIAGLEGNPVTGSGPASTTGTTPVLVATFQDTGTPGAASSYTATINWGDGTATSSAATITSQGTADGVVYYVYGNHTYDTPGSYSTTVTITNTANGAVASASGQAVIADAPLTPSTTQPTASTTEDVAFSGAVGSFTDGDPLATTGDYSYVMIDWGDGTPETAGTISQPGGVGTAFIVSGTHTYADAGVNGGTGHFAATIDVHDNDGASVAITNTIAVADVALTVTGKLNPASDSGVSDTDNITDVVQPTFLGTTNQPGATISLYATASGSSTPVLIGTGVSNASDAWSITANQALANGAYAITAVAVDSSGNTVSPTTTIVSDLVIDTVGPKVTSVTFSRSPSEIVVTFQDYGGLSSTGSGLVASSLADATNYQLITVHHPRVGKYRFNVISVTPGTTTGTQTVTLSINNGKYLKGGWYFFTIDSASPSNPSGVRDIAGNALDGEFYGYFPSGNNVNGGNFVAQLTAIHHRIYAPSTAVGRATPVTPPGTREHLTYMHQTINPSKFRQGTTSSQSRSSHRTARAAVHHANPAVSHLLQQVSGPKVATASTSATGTQSTAIGALDLALDQLGTSKKQHQS